MRAIPEGLIPREAVIRLNLPVLLFSLGVAVLTALLCGLVPALRAARRDLVEPLKDSGKGGGGGFRGRRLNGVLVVAEVALSLVLLAGAALFTLRPLRPAGALRRPRHQAPAGVARGSSIGRTATWRGLRHLGRLPHRGKGAGDDHGILDQPVVEADPDRHVPGRRRARPVRE